jgi:hypothetical protein
LTLEEGAGSSFGVGAGAGALVVAGLVEVGMTTGVLVVVGAFVGVFVGAGAEGVVSSSSSSSSQYGKSSSSSGVTGVVTVDVGSIADADEEAETEGIHCEGRAVSSFSVAWGKCWVGVTQI